MGDQTDRIMNEMKNKVSDGIGKDKYESLLKEKDRIIEALQSEKVNSHNKL